MTDQNRTAISVLMDRSGSMIDIREDAEGGLRQFIADQRQQPGSATLRLAQFDNEYELVHPSIDLADVPEPTLVPRGMTALLDAWGRSMTEFGEELAALPEQERPGTVIFVVITDGLENASQEWSREQIFAAVRRQTDEYRWQFVFLAANQDAVAVGRGLGVAEGSSLTYGASGAGAQGAYAAASSLVSRSRSGRTASFTDAERKQAADAADS